jgi:hypothetical protein
VQTAGADPVRAGPAGLGVMGSVIADRLARLGTLLVHDARADAAARRRGGWARPACGAHGLSGRGADSTLLQEFFVTFVDGDLTPTGRVVNLVKDLESARDHTRGAACRCRSPRSSPSSIAGWWRAGPASPTMRPARYYDQKVLPEPVGVPATTAMTGGAA